MLGELELLALVTLCFGWDVRKEGEKFQEGTQNTHPHLNAAVRKFFPLLDFRVLSVLIWASKHHAQSIHLWDMATPSN